MFKEIKQKAEQLRKWASRLWKEYFPPIQKNIEWEEVLDALGVQEERSLTRKVAIFRGLGLAFVILGYLMYHTMEYLYLLIAAYIISLALEGIVSFFSRLTRSRGIGIIIAYVLLILFLIAGCVVIMPFILNRTTEILNAIIGSLQQMQALILQQGVEEYLMGIHWLPEFVVNEMLGYIETADATSLLHTITNNLGNIVSLSTAYLKTFWGFAMNMVGWIFARAGKMLILLTLSILFSISHFDIKYSLKYLFRRKAKSAEKIEEVYGGIAHRLKAQILLCCVIGITTYIGLWILSWIGMDLPQKGTLALIIGIFEIFPYIGPWLGAVPAAVSALALFGFKGLIAVVALYTIIQQCEDKFLCPLVMNKTLWVSPVLVFSCLLFGGLLMGFFGVLLAVPIAVICTIVFQVPAPKLQKKKKKTEDNC